MICAHSPFPDHTRLPPRPEKSVADRGQPVKTRRGYTCRACSTGARRGAAKRPPSYEALRSRAGRQRDEGADCVPAVERVRVLLRGLS